MSSRFTLTQHLVGGAGDSKRRSFCPTGDERWRLLALTYLPNENSATNGTNYVGVRPYVGATAAAADRNTSATSLTQGTDEQIALTGTQSQLEVTKDLPFTVRAVQVASGVAYDLSIIAEFERMGSF